MKAKLRDNTSFGVKLRRQRRQIRKKLEETLGKESNQMRKVIRECKENRLTDRKKLRKKNDKKCQFLIKKYGMSDEIKFEVDEKCLKKYMDAKIFKDDSMRGDELHGPVIVCGNGDEEITLNDDEKKFLSLGPKFCIYNKISDEGFEQSLEEGIVKLKWEWMGEESKSKSKSLSDLAVDVALNELMTEAELEAENEESEILEAKMRMVYDVGDKDFNFSRKRVTDFKGNTRVVLPPKSKNFDHEATLEMLRVEMKNEYRKYEAENPKNCKGGSNLSNEERRGMKSLKKRVLEGEVVVLPTDKSGRFAIMKREVYEASGLKHCNKDEVVTDEVVKDTQNELNGHMSMLTKVFKLGQNWDQVERVRETLINGSLSVCPMYLLYKDHKGWRWEDGGIPPTRPIASGNQGMNLHLSELISEIIEPVADEFEGGFETISTEDMQARFMNLNDENTDWTTLKWWRGKTDEAGIYEACGKCEGDPVYEFDENLPEICRCEDDNCKNLIPSTEGSPPSLAGSGNNKEQGELAWGDSNLSWGSDDDSIIKLRPSPEGSPPPQAGENSKKATKVTANFLRKKRLEDWNSNNNLEKGQEEDLFTMLEATQVLPEMFQNFETPQIIIGCDVESLYPSLNIETCCDTIYQDYHNVGEIDYLEGCRYIAHNWGKEQCRASNLRRILPMRRSKI